MTTNKNKLLTVSAGMVAYYTLLFCDALFPSSLLGKIFDFSVQYDDVQFPSSAEKGGMAPPYQPNGPCSLFSLHVCTYGMVHMVWYGV